jgi:hypothetical protein
LHNNRKQRQTVLNTAGRSSEKEWLHSATSTWQVHSPFSHGW